MPKLATMKEVEKKTRYEFGRISHHGTTFAKVYFAKTFTRPPRVMVQKGEVKQVTTEWFIHVSDNPDEHNISYTAFPSDEEV